MSVRNILICLHICFGCFLCLFHVFRLYTCMCLAVSICALRIFRVSFAHVFILCWKVFQNSFYVFSECLSNTFVYVFLLYVNVCVRALNMRSWWLCVCVQRFLRVCIMYICRVISPFSYGFSICCMVLYISERCLSKFEILWIRKGSGQIKDTLKGVVGLAWVSAVLDSLMRSW
jgi:hypothetical protein